MSVVSTILFDRFGFEFESATQEQRLALMEAVAFGLRVEGAWTDNLCAIPSCACLPASAFARARLGRNEGLKLLAILQVAIVEGYSVSAANERLAN